MEDIYYPEPKLDYKVLVRCFTYNQSKYIQEALNGFAMQNTIFPFACVVVDDFSTDGEQEVIKAWMDDNCDMQRAKSIDIPTSVVIIVPHKTNVNCTFAFYLLKQNLYREKERKMNHVMPWRNHCDYEAICEGDDYWIDENKLQIQVDYLDANPSCAMVHCLTKRYIEAYGKLIEPSGIHSTCSFEELLRVNPISTLTTMVRMKFREEYHREYKKWETSGWKIGDYPFWLWISKHGAIHLINKVVSVYRILPNSASHSTDLGKTIGYINSKYNIQLHFANMYGANEKIKHAILNDRNGDIAIAYIKNNMIKESFQYLRTLPLSNAVMLTLRTLKATLFRE